MNPEELIAEVEALDKAATSEPWWVSSGGMLCNGANEYVGERRDLILAARYRTLAPELARMLRETRAELATLRAAQTPRPIAEAPKDGRDVLVLWSERDRLAEVMRWDDEHMAWMRFDDAAPWVCQPTHFLPLPVTP